MDNEEHVSYQKIYFEEHHKKTMQPTTSPYIERQIERMIVSGQLTLQDKIIDVGCGIGKYTLNLLEKGFQIDGLDIAQGLLDQMSKHNRTGRRLSLYASDISDPPQDLIGKYDIAIGFFALHHMFDLEKAFQGISMLLKPKGRFCFLEPNPYNILYYLQILLTPKMTWQGDKGIVKMRRSVLLPALTKAKFHSFRVQRFGFFPPFITNLRGAVGIEKILERFPLWKRLLPFQIISAVKY